jgi:CRISPR-associated protein (TIGR03986 family)
MPDWAHLVSHDVPFKDGISGVIEYNLTNATPLCIGDKKDDQNVLRFSRNPNGQPIVPASSLKGMVRNVLDIASFGKFNQVDDFKLSYRDIYSRSAYLKLIDKYKPVAGWIKYNAQKGRWTFTRCQVAKLHHDEINKQLGVSIRNEETAIKRYSKLPLTQKMVASISEPKGMKKNRWAEGLGKGETEGYCVFTNTRILGKGDANSYNFSYFFYAKQEVITSELINEQVQNLFTNHRSVTDRVDGINYDQAEYMIKHAHPEHGIPVFALMMQGKVHSFGFANMPRVSYKNSNHDLINHLSKEHMDDAYFSLSELMFGTLRNEGLGLKSRVQFSDAVLSNKETSIVSKPVVLGAPKPSFLGAYIEQPEPEQYYSYGYHNETETAKVAGWKRYPVMKELRENELLNDNEKVQTKLELLTENHTFQGRVVFHNLKREELAALVWVLSMNNSSDLYHSLGHGKPLGAGAIQFELKLNSDLMRSNSGELDNITVKDLVQEFTMHMDGQLKLGQWLETPQLKHLLALSDDYISHENDFFYPKLEDFQKIKNNKSSIDPLSYQGVVLSRTERAPEKMGSLSFGKGRLASLFSQDSKHHQEMQQLASEKILVLDKRRQKEEQVKRAKQLKDASPFDKSIGLLELVVTGQEGATKSFAKDKSKDITEVTKVLKEIELSSEDITRLIEVTSQISIAIKQRDKLLKWLDKQ